MKQAWQYGTLSESELASAADACHLLPPGLQVLVVGKVSQAVVLSWAAYRDEATFRDWTGIENSKLVCDATFDTQVSAVCGWSLPRIGAAQTPRGATPRHSKVCPPGNEARVGGLCGRSPPVCLKYS